MNKKTKQLLILEGFVIIFSLLPLLFTWLIPLSMGQTLDDELMLFIYGLCIYLVYPFLSLTLGMVMTLCGMDWRFSGLCGALSYVLTSIILLGLSAVDILVFGLLDAALGIGPAYLVFRYKTRKAKDNAYLGRG